MRRIETFSRGYVGVRDLARHEIRTVEILSRDLRLMRTVVRAAETHTRNALGLLHPLSKAVDAFNAPEKRKPVGRTHWKSKP